MMKQKIATKSQIRKFVKEAISRSIPNGWNVKYSEISVWNAIQVMFARGINVLGYERVLQADGVQHTIKKHGQGNEQNRRTHTPVYKVDFERLSSILENAKIVYTTTDRRNGNVLITWEAKRGQYYYYVEEIRKSKKRLVLKTMYKRKSQHRKTNWD